MDNAEVLKEMNKVDSILMIDILPYVSLLEEPFLTECFEPPRKGVYIKGDINPILYENVTYFTLSEDRTPEIIQLNYSIAKKSIVKNIYEQIKLNENIYNLSASVVISANDLLASRKFLFKEPTIPAQAVKAGISVILSYLNRLCSYTSVNDISYNLDTIVKDKYKKDIIHNNKFETVFETLLDKVADWVGKDSWCIFTYKIKGTSIIIEKGLDYRIYDWYRINFYKDEE